MTRYSVLVTKVTYKSIRDTLEANSVDEAVASAKTLADQGMYFEINPNESVEFTVEDVKVVE